MKNKIIALILIIIVIVLAILFCVTLNKNESDKIPNDFIATFYGDDNKKVYATYVYKIDNKQDNYGFKCINVVITTKLFKTITKILETKEVSFTDDVFITAKENNAYSYVKIPNDNKKYSIEEYQSMFLMN